MKKYCHCGKMAEKALTYGDEKLYLCDDCASDILVDVAQQLEEKGKATVIKFKGTERGVVIGKNICTRCNHSWTQRTFDIPTVCPKCKSPYWNKEKE